MNPVQCFDTAGSSLADTAVQFPSF